MSATYPSYLDDLLLAVADRQVDSKIVTINLRKLHEEHFEGCPETWLQTASTEFYRMGYGIDWQDSLNESFRISGGGLRRAQEIRDSRSAATFLAKTKKFMADNWIALAALAVSIFALSKS